MKTLLNNIFNKIKMSLLASGIFFSTNLFSQSLEKPKQINSDLDSSYVSKTIQKIQIIEKDFSRYGQIDEIYKGNSDYFLIFLPQHHYRKGIENTPGMVEIKLLVISFFI